VTTEVAEPAVKETRLLIVDDNADYVETARRLLSRLIPHCTVDSAGLARTGLAKMRATRYDCVLLDLVLPCLHGEDLLEELLTSEPDVPIVVISGKIGNRPDLDADLIALGAQDVVNKAEVKPEVLAKTVLHAIARHKHRALALKHIDKASGTAEELKQSIETQATVLDEKTAPDQRR
jgi:CheY-like chemotaxis protein